MTKHILLSIMQILNLSTTFHPSILAFSVFTESMELEDGLDEASDV